MTFHPDPYRLESPDEIQHGTSQLGGISGPGVFGPERAESGPQPASVTPVRRYAPGPKGYKRSDQRIREDVCERLLYAELDASDVSVDVEDSIVTLTGTVEDRRTKHTVEEITAHTSGVREVDNQIRVDKLPSSQLILGTPSYSLVSSGSDPGAGA